MRFTPERTEIVLSDAARPAPFDAWTWFTDEHTIVDSAAGPGGPRLLVGSVTSGSDTGGDIVILWCDLGSRETGYVELHGELEQDDHDVPALFVRPDGHYLAMYSKHGNDPYTRWRISTAPHDPEDWSAERTLDNGTGTTYCNVYWLPGDFDGDGKTSCFTRTANWDPNILVSSDVGSTWHHGGRLLRQDGDDRRPYLRYASDGERIHFVASDDHPNQFDTSVYHGYVEDGALLDAAGRVLNQDLLGDETAAPEPDELSTVFTTNSDVDGTRTTRGWPVDVAVDAAGRPVTLFQALADGDPSDHRLFYARYDENEWRTEYVARIAPPLYDVEDDYTELASIDPDDPASIVVSTPIDPRDESWLDHYELFAAGTTDDGASWNWEALTPGATEDNLRPMLPAWSDERSALVWMRGEYDTYTHWETEAVARVTGNSDQL